MNNFSHEYSQCSFNVEPQKSHTTWEDEQAINLSAWLISLEPVSQRCVWFTDGVGATSITRLSVILLPPGQQQANQ